jgi:RNA methyltransferase, TrmH family
MTGASSVVVSARKDPSKAVLEGLHAVKHAVRFGAEIERVVVSERAVVERLAARVAPDVVGVLDGAEEVGEAAFLALSPVPVRTGVLAVAARPAQVLGDGAPVVLLEAPQDLTNAGACVRVAAAAGAGGVLVLGGTKDPWSPEALRGSAGLHFAVPVLRADAPPEGRPLVAFDPGGAPFDPRRLQDDAVLAFGTERDGLSGALKDRADAVVALPMQPGVSSLNLATSVSAALYAWRLR